ncbi:hypothetical protein [Desulfosarcina ovata]|uniref:Uncharacterized protein n=1 Tax=Desulfosarcina ovata subsp. ovata TaxID=2752305 RepID=A0A5K8ABI6_9BACT|nr:hypothetical protein [Desulfosarcina ovata]BBO90012.1 hypothetical protein DSCOOX_31920 [Desulfosarcina ovata subsp. ovata]
MQFNRVELEKRVRNFSDEELVEMIDQKSDQYQEDAMEIALKVANERGGIENLKNRLKKEKDNEAAEKELKQKEQMEHSKMKAQEQIQKREIKERLPVRNSELSDYKSPYKTTRLIAQVVANIGSVITVISCIALLVTIVSASQSRYGFQWIGLLPAFGGIICGIFLSMIGQLTRAVVDNSDNTGETLSLLKKEFKNRSKTYRDRE